MAGLKWLRIEANWYQNPKFLMLSEDKKWRAIAVYWAGVGHTGGQGNDGFIPYYALSLLHGTKKEATELVAVGLWIPCEGGWNVNDWSEHQETSDETRERSKKARAAAMVRWHGAPSNASSMLRALPNAMLGKGSSNAE